MVKSLFKKFYKRVRASYFKLTLLLLDVKAAHSLRLLLLFFQLVKLDGMGLKIEGALILWSEINSLNYDAAIRL